jgi:2-polyprenyl-3-methyl-5-hydroxy-6-metoxy-1,4-benzoquinol methylase
VHSDKERAWARQLSAESVAAGDATGWFERLYAEAEAGVSVVPWADGLPDPQLVEWADRAGSAGSDGAGRRALVVGCGFGYDAEFLAGRGFAVTAFDLSATAIAAAKRLYPDSRVTYLAADQGRALARGRAAAGPPDREVPRRRGVASAPVAGRVPPRRLSG